MVRARFKSVLDVLHEIRKPSPFRRLITDLHSHRREIRKYKMGMANETTAGLRCGRWRLCIVWPQKNSCQHRERDQQAQEVASRTDDKVEDCHKATIPASREN